MERYVLGVFSFEIGELAPWLQAVGSILAIAVAIWLNRKQSLAAEELASKQHMESLELISEQNRQTESRERAAYHRSMADRLVPIAALIEHWHDIIVDAIEASSQGCVDVQDMKKREKIRGVEAAQVDDAIKRVDVQVIPEIQLVNDFIRMRHLSKLMVAHVYCLKSKGSSQEELIKAAKALNYDLPKVVVILTNFSKSRDDHLMKAGVYFDT